MTDLTLRNGISVPPIGFGTWKIENSDAAETVNNAIGSGYRHIDTAAAYGNGFYVGKAIKKCGVPREELFVSCKLWNASRAEEAYDSCKKNLKLMKLDYFDLFLIHWPASPAVHENWKEINAETWRQMEKLYSDGLVKAIGVSNFTAHHLETLKNTAEIIPMVNQIEFHPGFFQKDTLEYCDDNNIVVEAWSPIGSGALLSEPLLNAVSQKYSKSAAQICLRWCVQHGVIPVAKSVNPERMKQNLEIFDFEISNDDMKEIDNMPTTAYSGLNPDTIIKFG